MTYPPTNPGKPEKVILILDAITTSVTGTVTFGEGTLPLPDPIRSAAP